MREHVVWFLDSIGAHAKEANLCLREFLKSLINQAYTLYVNLKLGLVHDLKHLVLYSRPNSFC